MNDKVTMVQKAREFAQRAHEGQTYGDGSYFDNHVAKVAELVEKYSGYSKYVVAAYLHDVVEDTDITLQEIADEFGPAVVEMVSELTHDDNVHYMNYLMNLRTDGSRVIKYCDMMMNYKNARSARSALKYEMGLIYLYRAHYGPLSLIVPSVDDIITDKVEY